MKTVTIVNADDWMGLYIDGELVYEGHSIEEETLLKYVGVNCDSFWVDDNWITERGNLPSRLEDVKKDE